MPKAIAKSGHHRKASAVHFPLQLHSARRADGIAKATEPELQRLTACLDSLASRYHALIQGYGARLGIAGVQYTVLTTIRHLETRGDVFLVTIAENLRLTSAGVTKTIQHLTELGLVEKAEDAGDRRRTRLTVTASGRALLDSLVPVQARVNDVWLDCMNAREFAMFLDLVERFIKSSDRALALQNYLDKDDLV